MNYDQLHAIVFSGDYPGYRPEVRELPNGDGRVDADKRYAHIASKYLAKYRWGIECAILQSALDEAHDLSIEVARALDVPPAFWPVREYSALRVLEYPAGAISNVHTDFDLFTLMMHRSHPIRFVAHDMQPGYDNTQGGEALFQARRINHQLHLGELAEQVGVGRATPHEVVACDEVQRSIVYFAIPDHFAVLPSGLTVGEWLAERMSRSRVVMGAA